MKLYKFFAPAIILSLVFSSCAQKDYNCVCTPTGFCPMPYVQDEIKGSTHRDAKSKCDSYDIAGGRECEVESTTSSVQ